MNSVDKSKQGKFIFATIILGLVMILYLGGNKLEKEPLAHEKPYSSGERNIAVIDIVGTICEDDGYTYNQQWVLDSIANAYWDRDNCAILLYIDSPGGTVYESDEVYLALMEYKKTGASVYAYMASQATSGGYYIAAAADEIYANRNTLTGSIGVIMGQSIDLTGFFEKYGIKMTTVTAGKNKNMFNIDEPVTEEQLAIMQSIADEAYDQFVEIVADSRDLSIAETEILADGRIYTAKQALNLGLIDGIMSYDEYAQMLCDQLDAECTYYAYEAETNFINEWLGIRSEKEDIRALTKVLNGMSGLCYYCGEF